jgi:hypothetical protein
LPSSLVSFLSSATAGLREAAGKPVSLSPDDQVAGAYRHWWKGGILPLDRPISGIAVLWGIHVEFPVSASIIMEPMA